MKKPKNQKQRQKNLYELVERQQGLFTAHQAVNIGFNESHHPYHVKAGNWIRMERGIYRLANFPFSNEEQYILWTLWSRNRKDIPQGVISHATALELYSLSDHVSQKIHLIVPKGFRRSAEIPKKILLHYSNLSKDDIRERSGFRMTTPARTLVDLIQENKISPEFVEQALNEAYKRGLITGPLFKDLGKQIRTERWGMSKNFKRKGNSK